MHEKFEGLVDVLVAGGLDERESRNAEEHAARCGECGSLLRDAREFATWVRATVAKDAPPADLEHRIVGRFRASGIENTPIVWPTVSPKLWKPLAAVAAVIALVVIGRQYRAHSIMDASKNAAETANSPIVGHEGEGRQIAGWTGYPGLGAGDRPSYEYRKRAEHDHVPGYTVMNGVEMETATASGPPRHREANRRDLSMPASHDGIRSRFAGSTDGWTGMKLGFSASTADTGKLYTLAIAADIHDSIRKSAAAGGPILTQQTPSDQRIDGAYSERNELPPTNSTSRPVEAPAIIPLDRVSDKLTEVGTWVEKIEQSGRGSPEADAMYRKVNRYYEVLRKMCAADPVRLNQLDAYKQRADQAAADPNGQDRKIIHNASLTLEVDNYDAAYTKLSDVVAAEKGFIAAANAQKLPNGKAQAKVTVRVPPHRVDAVLAVLRTLGTVRNQSIDSQDISKAYIDLEMRRLSKTTLAERLRIIIKEGKGTVKELMEVEVELGKTVEAIEQITGELKYYDNLVSLATIVLNIAEKDLAQPFEYVQTLQANLGLTVTEADLAYAAAQKAILDAGGQVVDAKMEKQSDGSAAAFIRGRVDATKFPDVRGTLKKLGHVDVDTVNVQQKAQGGDPNVAKSDAPLRREQAVIDITLATTQIVVTRKAGVALETNTVDKAYQTARKTIEDAGGRIIDGSMIDRTDGSTATVRAQVDADKFTAVFEALKALGPIKNAGASSVLPPTAATGGTPLIRERADIELTINTPPRLLPQERGIARTFSQSMAGLMWSVENLFVGISLAGPWVVLALIAWLVYRKVRSRKTPAAPTSTPNS